MLDKYTCLQKLAALRNEEVVISTMSTVMPWAALSDGPLDYASVNSAMGHAADFAYGIALAQPSRRVIMLNGDGSMLMSLGTLVMIAQRPASNFSLVILQNGTYEVTGNQPIPGAGCMDLETIVRGAGIESVHTIATEADFDAKLPVHLHGPGQQVFIWLVERAEEPIPQPKLPIRERTHRLREALLGGQQ